MDSWLLALNHSCTFYTINCSNSRLTPSVVTDETHLADQVKKKREFRGCVAFLFAECSLFVLTKLIEYTEGIVIREHKSSAKAIRFSNLYGKLSSQVSSHITLSIITAFSSAGIA